MPIPPPPPVPRLPETGCCEWSFDAESRVLLANFRCPGRRRGGNGANENVVVRLDRDDEIFLLEMMERDDLTVISEGLADAVNDAYWTREYIEGCIGSEYHHKFRSFETIPSPGGGGGGKQQQQQPRENEGWYSMKVADYFRYLQRREDVKGRRSSDVSNAMSLEREFTFTDSDGKEITVDVENEAIYMIDVDAMKLLPHAFEDFQLNFKLPGILPGGSHCMMNAVNANGRPFMGPNLYLTPPTTFTNFHQDGHGTVDSGHWCLTGYNEVVMLRRLTERHKFHAVQLLTGTSDAYGTLYGLPHRDGMATQPGWPSSEAIGLCKKMGYCPSVFILKAGQVVHINKGRLHAFRKLSPLPLHETDCHYELRKSILQTKEQTKEDICCSIAWDWMFKGVTSEGINREVSSILECSRLNRQHYLQSLAIPETALLFLAKENIAKNPIESMANAGSSPFLRGKFAPDSKTVLRGILPSLEYVVTRHSSAVAFSKLWEERTKNVKDSWCVLIDSKPNTWQNPDKFPLDPYGAGDFFCKICAEELSNVYMHCDGCEKLLNKDFNICSGCHRDGRYKVFHQMHPFNPKPFSILNHTGNKFQLRQARCPCKNGKECAYCSFCTGCSCRCHQRFTVHYRFMEQENEVELLHKAESIVGFDTIPRMEETRLRLLSLISEEGVDNPVTNEVKKDEKGVSSNDPLPGLPPQWSSSLITPPEEELDNRVKTEITPQVAAEPLRPLKKRFYPPSTSSSDLHSSDDNGRQADNSSKEVHTAPALTLAGAVPVEVDDGPKISCFMGQTNGNRDETEVASIETVSGPQTYARQVSTHKQVMDKKSTVVTFHCKKCDKDFKYSSAKTAGASFSNHMRRCGQKNQKAAMATPESYLSETEVKVDETQADFKTQIDPNELTMGSNVYVKCNKGQEWLATLIRPREKGGVQGFHIRYKGQKRKRRVSDEEWVPIWSVLRVTLDK
ncbi:hypothetical protein ACHAW5_005458 [Stephanodiscus triporus]|uniref:C2H2-type domain-containing protein n=1 Tax=Stephanodiscus triporus TaxID=2934178 RepID=A0ABD3QI54_9STRA